MEAQRSTILTNDLPALVGWDAFQSFPERPENGLRYELQDGEVVQVPLPPPRHLYFRMRLGRILRFVEDSGFVVGQEYLYRPAREHQFWGAQVAVLPRRVLKSMVTWADYAVYAPPLIVEVLTQSGEKVRGSNTPGKIARQRLAAMSNGTREFWVVDADKKTIVVTTSEGVKLYGPGDSIPLSLTPGQSVSIDQIFAKS